MKYFEFGENLNFLNVIQIPTVFSTYAFCLIYRKLILKVFPCLTNSVILPKEVWNMLTTYTNVFYDNEKNMDKCLFLLLGHIMLFFFYKLFAQPCAVK
jgi:hypothetical protein